MNPDEARALIIYYTNELHEATSQHRLDKQQPDYKRAKEIVIRLESLLLEIGA